MKKNATSAWFPWPALIALCMTSVAWAQQQSTISDDAAASRIAWWRDAKFGLFMHWGVYSIPGRGEWVQWNEQIPVNEYAKLATQFNPDEFDPDAWAVIAKTAGMKYTVLTARQRPTAISLPSTLPQCAKLGCTWAFIIRRSTGDTLGSSSLISIRRTPWRCASSTIANSMNWHRTTARSIFFGLTAVASTGLGSTVLRLRMDGMLGQRISITLVLSHGRMIRRSAIYENFNHPSSPTIAPTPQRIFYRVKATTPWVISTASILGNCARH